MRKFIIFTPPYDEKKGGTICLHQLANMLNKLGYEAYIFPSFENILFSKRDFLIPSLKLLREFGRSLQKFKVNKDFITPIYDGSIKSIQSDEWIVIYYEQVSGNPLGAKNIVRWLLHQPGYHTGTINYGFNEFHVKFNEAVRDFHYPNCQLASFLMPIIYYPLNLYNLNDTAENRYGTAYCIRKGKGKQIRHDLTDSVLIDNLPHQEVAQIFKRVKTFISYDSYTAYSRFAALCGCDSIVIPDDGVSLQQWYPDPKDRYGVAYDFEDINFARETRLLLKEKILNEIRQSMAIADSFAEKANDYFNKPRYGLFRKKYA